MAQNPSAANPVAAAINRLVSNARVRMAMLVGSGLESGWNAGAVGDGGTSFGPFQMHIGGALTANNGTPAQAKDPNWATRAMLSEYTAAAARVPDSMWRQDPKNAAALAAYYAERPARMYAQSRVDSVWRQLGSGVPAVGTGAAPAGGAPGPAPPAGAAGGPQGFGPDLNPLNNWVDPAKKLLITALFVSAGLGLAAMGAYQGVAPARQKMAGAVTAAATKGALA